MPKINTRAKGNRVQLKAIKELEYQGFLVSIVERNSRYIKEKDCFGLFDLAVLGSETLTFIQIKTNTTGGFIKKLTAFSKEHQVPGVLYGLCVWYDRKGWKQYWFKNGEQIT